MRYCINKNSHIKIDRFIICFMRYQIFTAYFIFLLTTNVSYSLILGMDGRI